MRSKPPRHQENKASKISHVLPCCCPETNQREHLSTLPRRRNLGACPREAFSTSQQTRSPTKPTPNSKDTYRRPKQRIEHTKQTHQRQPQPTLILPQPSHLEVRWLEHVLDDDDLETPLRGAGVVILCPRQGLLSGRPGHLNPSNTQAGEHRQVPGKKQTLRQGYKRRKYRRQPVCTSSFLGEHQDKGILHLDSKVGSYLFKAGTA